MMGHDEGTLLVCWLATSEGVEELGFGEKVGPEAAAAAAAVALCRELGNANSRDKEDTMLGGTAQGVELLGLIQRQGCFDRCTWSRESSDGLILRSLLG
jgi:hypothetical protein